jgi:DnaK suppressor protein
MRKNNMDKIRAVLLKRRDALRQALAGDIHYLSNTKEQVGDEIDAALDTAAGEASSQLAEVESRELAEIELALTRIKEGHYGKCEDCQKTIGAIRLQALPYATLCINCARNEERHRHSGMRSGDKFAGIDD